MNVFTSLSEGLTTNLVALFVAADKNVLGTVHSKNSSQYKACVNIVLIGYHTF